MSAEDIRHPEKQPIVFEKRWRSLEATIRIRLKIHFDIWQNQYNIVKLKNKIKLKQTKNK